MAVVEESGFIFTPPDETWCRFARFPTYRTQLSGKGIAEMDFAYWDAVRNRLVLLEVKDYTGREAPTHLVSSLIAKGRDCLMMLQSAWRSSGAGLGASLAADFPERLRVPSRVQLIFVLNVDETTRMRSIKSMRDQVAWSIRAYAELLDLHGDATLMDQDKASKVGLPLRRGG
jgi:hypothetical protein